jgi:hypothetical protein
MIESKLEDITLSFGKVKNAMLSALWKWAIQFYSSDYEN